MAGSRTNDIKVYCSFCGKSQDDVKKIIAGNNVFICNECVALSQEIIKEELAEEVLADLTEVPKPKELLDVLNQYVVGQDRAKRALSLYQLLCTIIISVSRLQKVVMTMMWIYKSPTF